MRARDLDSLLAALRVARYDARGVDSSDIIENVIQRISESRIGQSRRYKEYAAQFDALRKPYDSNEALR
jgi:hypothetical protein